MPLMGSGLGNVLSLSSAIDVDVAAFFATMDAAAESYLPAEKALLNNLVKSLKSAGLWSRFTLLWFPVGATLTGAMRALKHPSGAGFKMTNNGFLAADWNSNVGLDQQQRQAWIATGTNESQYPSPNDFHMMVHSLSWTGSDPSGLDIGSENSNGPMLFTSLEKGTRTIYRTQGSGTGTGTTNFTGDNYGFFLASTLNADSYTSKNGGVYGSRSDTPLLPNRTSTLEMTIFRGRGITYSGKLLSSSSLGKGFTSAEHSQVNTIFQQAHAARAFL